MDLRILLAWVLGASTALPVNAADVINGFPLDDLSVPREFVFHGGPPRDGIPALTDPTFIPADKASDLQATDRVLGLEMAGEVKAYPLSIMVWHEIVNDRFGDIPVAVTYCPLCFTGMAFRAKAEDKRMLFGVSGLLYNSDVLLYDRATESLWSQILSEAVSGQLKGKKLDRLPLANTTWGEWQKRHPDSLVLSFDTGHGRDYGRNPYQLYDVDAQVMFPVRFRAEGYHPKERVLGVQIGGKTKAYPFLELRKSELPLKDEIAGKKLVLDYYQEYDYAVVHDDKGNEIPSVMAYWFAWYAFYPETDIYKAPLTQRRER